MPNILATETVTTYSSQARACTERKGELKSESNIIQEYESNSHGYSSGSI